MAGLLRGLEQAKHVVTDVNLEPRQDVQRLAPQVPGDRLVLLNQVRQEPVPRVRLLREVVVRDANQLQSYLMAAT
jgi:hypothetical protein